MSLKHAGRWGTALLATTSILAQSFPAHAQTQIPGAVPPQASQAAAAPASGEIGFLDQLVQPCKNPKEWCAQPRAARPSTIGPDTPFISKERYLRDYPQMGLAGWNSLRSANHDLCQYMYNYLANLKSLDQLFELAGTEYDLLQEVYEALPKDVKRATAIMTVAQAGQAGALCALTAGLYCIAVVAGGIGNVFVAHSSKKLQLANIRLSIANIVVTKLNIWSNRLTLRLDAWWIDWYSRGCARLGYQMTMDNLLDMPALPSVPQGFGKPR